MKTRNKKQVAVKTKVVYTFRTERAADAAALLDWGDLIAAGEVDDALGWIPDRGHYTKSEVSVGYVWEDPDEIDDDEAMESAVRSLDELSKIAIDGGAPLGTTVDEMVAQVKALVDDVKACIEGR